jgi:FkbM family methyltransferase
MNLAEIEVDEKGTKMHLIVTNDMTAFRAKSFWTKEPHTIEWLKELRPERIITDFKDEKMPAPQRDLLWDIGANVGVYSLFAGARGIDVMAFEPESQNYALLNSNIFYNRLNDRITAYPFALGDKTSIDVLNLTKFDTGMSCHQFGDMTAFGGQKEMASDYSQGAICLRGHTIVELTGRSPTHVKIDVDGHEPQVVEGLLGIDTIQSMIIETNWNRDDHRDMVSLLEAEGFTWSQEQADGAKRKTGSFIDCGETIFTRPYVLQDRQRDGADLAVPASLH